MTTRILQQSYYIPNLIPDITPKNVTRPVLSALIRSFRTIDLDRSQYIIATVEPDNREFWTSVLSSVLLVLAAIGIITMYLVDGAGNSIDAAIDGVERIGNGLREKYIEIVSMAASPRVKGVYYVA